MQVLKVLSAIWKCGAEIYRDESDGRLALKNANLIPAEVLQAAEPIFGEIEKWFGSWEKASSIDLTMQKALHLFCGWQTNKKMNDWLCADYDSLMLLHDWTVILSKNGWIDIYADYREFENDESNAMKIKFYEQAKLYASQNK